MTINDCVAASEAMRFSARGFGCALFYYAKQNSLVKKERIDIMEKKYVKICPYCGKENANLARYCYFCSKNISRIRANDYLEDVKPDEVDVFSDRDVDSGKTYEKKLEKMLERKANEEAEAEQKHREELADILISSGFSFEGYRIVKYSGYISGDDAIQIPRSSGFFTPNNGKNLTDALVLIRRQAIKELKEAAHALGCNAVIGVDFDYITLEPQTASIRGSTVLEPYVICVTANGNAVVIEKE